MCSFEELAIFCETYYFIIKGEITGNTFLFVWEFLYYYGQEIAYIMLKSGQYLVHFNVDVDSFQKTIRVIYMCGTLLGFVLSWIADSYIGKKFIVFVGQILTTFVPILCFISSSEIFAKDLRLSTLYAASYMIAFTSALQGIRNALLLEQTALSRKERPNVYTIILVWNRQACFLLYELFRYMYKEDLDGFYYLQCRICVLASVLYLIISCMLVNKVVSERVCPQIVEQCIQCVYFALSVKMDQPSISKEHWVDHASTKCDPNVMQNVKVMYQLFISFIPLFCYGTTYAILINSCMRHTITVFHGEPYLDIMAGYIALSFVKCVGIPILEIFFCFSANCTLISTLLRRIAMGYFLLGCALLVSSAIEYKIDSDVGYMPVFGYGRVTIYNGIPNSIMINNLYIDNMTINLLPCESHTVLRFRTDLQKIITVTNQNQTAKYIIHATDFQTMDYVLNLREGLKLRYSTYLGDVGAYDRRPRLFAFSNSRKLDRSRVVFVKNGRTPITFPVGYKIEEYRIPEDNYTVTLIRHGTKHVKKVNYKFQNEAMYSLFLCNHKVVDIKINVVIDVTTIHYIFIFIPLILAGAGDVMTRISILAFVHSQSPKKVKSICFNYLHLVINSESGIILIGGEFWNRRPTSFAMVMFGCMHIVCCLCFIHFVIYYIDYNYKQEEVLQRKQSMKITNLKPALRPSVS